MNDKLKHFVISLILTVILSCILHYIISAIIVLIIGVCKELYDKYIKNTYFDWKDIIADAIGCVSGIVLYNLINYNYE